MPLWKIKDKTVDEKGLTTTKTITTENTAVMQKLLDMKEEPVKDKSKKTTEAKKESKTKAPAKQSGIVKLLTNTNFKAPIIQDPTKQVPKLRKEEPKKLEAPKKEVKPLPAPKKEDKKKSGLSKKPVEGKARIEHHSRNLNPSQISWSNSNSFNGTRGTNLKNNYEAYRHKIEFSGLTNKQKSKLLDKLYKLYEPILRYDSQYYSPMVSGPARYPQAKMDAIYDKMMKANSEFLDWWKSIEPQLEKPKLNPKDKKEAQEAEKKKEIERIKEGFNRWYNRLLEELPEYEKNGRSPKYSMNASLAQSYVTDALKVDTALYKELFEKLNKVCNFSKNSNIYKGYKAVLEGKLSSDSIQKQEAEDNKVIYSCSDYEISNLKIDAGKRIAIRFTFYPKPQLVYALKKRGFIWYSFKKCFICKPERFNLEWAKGISKQYEKYI